MKLYRISAIFIKDAQWAVKNLKLMTLMTVPVMISLLMNRLTGKTMFTYSLFFSMSFVGLILTSYIMTEEKRIGALKTLLVSPLTSSELILGKFLFPLTVCLGFSIMTFLLNQQTALLVKPAVFATLVLTIGTICMIGSILGLFFKNEQELGVVSPFIFLGFLAGNIIQKSSNKKIAGYFPDFHLGSLLDNYNHLHSEQIIGHIAFQAIYFLILFGMTTQYVKYFFSNDSEGSRINKKTIFFIPIFIGATIFSGKTFSFFAIQSKSTHQLSRFPMSLEHWSADIAYSADEFSVQPLKSDKEKTEVVSLKSKNDSISELTFSITHLEADEIDFEKRRDKLLDEQIYIISREILKSDLDGFAQTVSSSPLHYRTSFEKVCVNEALRISFEHPELAKNYQFTKDKALEILKSSTLNCK